MSTALKPCPFCGCEKPELTGDTDIWWVECQECHAEGPFAHGTNALEALDKWNRRALLPEDET